MNESQTCPTCGAPVEAGASCPACALELALKTVEMPAEELAQREGFSLFAPLTLPAAFAGYTLEREIASGGMGVVYQAVQQRPHRTVALKMIRSTLLLRAEDHTRFRTEIEAAARLDHPNIVPVYDVGDHQGQPYYTMKLMEGGTLAARLADCTSLCSDAGRAGACRCAPGRCLLDPRAAAQLVAQVARAVHHAHQRGVLHRDLKPGNILFDAAGTPYLSDFGLAKLSSDESAITLSQAVLGTPGYMSPEQASGRTRAVTTASDIWALGAILYQLLTGQMPFAAPSTPEILRRIVEQEPAPPSSVRRAVGADLQTLCLRCLEKEPARRPATALELAEDLERWLDGRPIRARPVTVAERFVKWARRHPAIAGLGALAALFALAGGIGVTVAWRNAVSARHAADLNAQQARDARDRAAEDAYYANVANALAERGRSDFGAARRMLGDIEPARRGFEWRLVEGLCRGDDTWSVRPGKARPAAMAIDPATTQAVVLCEDRSLFRIDPDTGGAVPAGRLPAPGVPIHRNEQSYGFYNLAISPDGKRFLVLEDTVLRVYAFASTAPLLERDMREGRAVWLDNDRILLGCDPRWRLVPEGPGRLPESAWIVDVPTGNRTPLPRYGFMGPLALSRDRQLIAICRNQTAFEVRRLADGFEGPPLSGASFPNGALRSLSFTDDSKHLLVVRVDHEDGRLRVVDWADQTILFDQVIANNSFAVFCPGEPVVASAGRQPWLTTWRYLEPARTASFDDGTVGFDELIPSSGPRFPPHGLLTRSAQEGRVNFLFGHEAPPQELLPVPDRRAILSLGVDGTIRRWPSRSMVSERQRRDRVDTLQLWNHPAASPDGQLVVYRHVNGQMRVWDRRDNSRFAFPEGQSVIAAPGDGQVLTRVNETGEVVCWRVAAGKGEELWRAPGGPSIQRFHVISHAVVSRDRKRVVALQPGKLLVIDLDTHTTRDTDNQRMNNGTIEGQTVDLSPDGRIIAVTGFNGRRVRLYDAEKPSAPFTPLVATDDPVSYDSVCAFSRDGRRLFVGNCDGWVRVFDVAGRKELPDERWQAHSSEISALAVSQTGDIVATAANGALSLWSATPAPGKARRERLRLPMRSPRNWIQFAGEDTLLFHAAPKEPIEVLEAPKSVQVAP